MQDTQKMLNNLVDAPSSSKFTINGKFECEFADKQLDEQFNDWKKEDNSPTMECEANVIVVDIAYDTVYKGTIVIHKNLDISGMLSGALYLSEKTTNDEKISYTMLSIISVEFN